MRLIRFGNSGLIVTEVGLGTRSFGDSVDEAACRQVLDRDEDACGNLVDTAVTYADGRGEEILGRPLVGRRRDRFVLSMKFGVRRIDELAVATASPLAPEHRHGLDRESHSEMPALDRFLREVRGRVDPCAASSTDHTNVDGNGSPHDE